MIASSFPDPLADRLEAAGAALARRCIEAMYADPFWRARFGDRGRMHSDEDSRFHVRYLASSLRANDPGIFERYAVWLRGVLASRGMCSWHLAESFRQLAAAMAVEAIPDPAPAIAVLGAGARALEYDAGIAGDVERARPAVVDRVRRELRDEAYRVEEIVSFLCDAFDRGDIDSTAAHLAFLDGTLASGEDERASLRSTVDAIVRAVGHEIGPAAGARARDLLRLAWPGRKGL